MDNDPGDCNEPDVIAIVPIHGENKVGYFYTRAEAEVWAEQEIRKAQADYAHAVFHFIIARRLRGGR